MAVKLDLKPIETTHQKQRLSSVFYVNDHAYVFRDQNDRQLKFTQREFAHIKPHLEIFDDRLKDVVKEAKVIYDFTQNKFRLIGSNQDLYHANKIAEPILENINHAAQNIHFVPMDKPERSESKKPTPTQTYNERLADKEKKVRVRDIHAYMSNLTRNKNIVHLTNPKKLNYADLKQNDLVFVSLTKNGHVTGLVFDNKQKRTYYYDPAGKDIERKDRKDAQKMCEKIGSKLGIKRVTSNPVDHQHGDHHCGRYLLHFYKQIAENPDTFDYSAFCHDENRDLDNMIADLQNLPPPKLPSTDIRPSGLKNVGNDCFLNAMFQSIIATGHAKHFANANNLLDQKNKPLQEAFAKLLDDYKKGKNPSTNAFRKLLGFDPKNQNDAQEALLRLMAHYQPISSNIDLTIPEASELKKSLQEKHSEIHHDDIFVKLPRFNYDDQDNQAYKLHEQMNVPEAVTIKGQMYTLQSFVTHKGNSMTNGHYTAHTKQNNTWHECDDTSVKPAQNALDRAKNAYILHYKKSTPASMLGG